MSLHNETMRQIGWVVRLLAVRRRICHNDEYLHWDRVQNGLAETETGRGCASISCDPQPLIGLQVPYLVHRGILPRPTQPSLENGIASSHCDYDNSTSNREVPCPISGQVEIIQWIWMAEPSRRLSRNPLTIDVIISNY
jgi:hypothetical protein